MPYLLVARQFPGDVKDTLSSWDKCMAKSYCKWPVIAVIILGSLIAISVVVCLARCICCGAECACCCFRCCCGGGRKSGHKRMDSGPPPAPVYAPNTQYQPHSMPTFSPAYASPPPFTPTAPPAHTPSRAPAPERPQFAQFDVSSKPINEDALPHMPSWKDAVDRKVEVEEVVKPEKPGDMEMNRLDRTGVTTTAAVANNPRRSPVKPRQNPSLTGNGDGYVGTYEQNSSFGGFERQPSPRMPIPYTSAYDQQQERYRGVSLVNTLISPQTTASQYGHNQPYGRSSPSPIYGQNYGLAPPRSPISPIGNHSYDSPQRGGYVEIPIPDISHSTNTAGVAPVRTPSPGYAPSGSTRYELPATAGPAYPGQQTYQAQQSYPSQQSYQAFHPAQEPSSGSWQTPQRKPVNGSWKDI